MSADPTDQPLSAESLSVLRDEGLISSELYWKGMRQLKTGREWLHWASVFCLILGVSLVLSGIVFFFAYNWEGLGRFAKLGILQGAVLLALLATLFLGLHRLIGKLSLLTASMLIGVCFAVYGQVYQTGADAFGFFAMWALCIIPWVLAGRFAPLWVLWLVLINLTAWFFWNQVGRFHQTMDLPDISLLLACVNGAAFVLSQVFGPKYEWLRAAWLRPLLMLGLLVPLTTPVCAWILDFLDKDPAGYFLSLAVWGLSVSGSFWFYNFKRFDATLLTMVLVDVGVCLLFLVGRGLAEVEMDMVGLFFLMAIVTISLCAALLIYVRHRVAAHASGGGELE